jgi:DNA polymerase elongation subunit (family B)
MIAYKTGSNYLDTLGTTSVWDSFIHRVLLSEKTVIPPRENQEGSWFEGAYVKPPQVGIHRWLTSFDFASLYPNIMIQLNISPETIVTGERDLICKPVDFLSDPDLKNPKPHYAMAANGVYFKKDKQGVIPRLTESVYNERVTTKSKMFELEKEVEKTDNPVRKEEILFSISALKNKEHALKILINSLYGAFGSQYFRYFSLPAAEAVTLTGQLAFHLTLSAVNKKLSKMAGYSSIIDYGITGDTDSVYFTMDEFVDRFKPDSPIDFVEKISDEIIEPTIRKEMSRMNSEILSGFKERLVMKREVIGSGFFVAKKHYALLVKGSEGGIRLSTPKLKIKGIAAIKSSTPKAIRSKMKELFMIILRGGSENEVFDFISHVKDIFYSLPVEKIAFPRGVNDIEKWVKLGTSGFGFIKGTPIQVKSAMLYNFLIKEHHLENTFPKIHSGDKIKFVYLKVPNPVRSEVIGFPNKLPSEFELSPYIDFQKMFEKTFLDTVDPILEKIGFGRYKGPSSLDLFSFFN